MSSVAETESPSPSSDAQTTVLPVLSLVATFAALADLVVNRIALRTLSEVAPLRVLFALGQWGTLARNLFAIAGLVALASALLAVLQSSRYASLRRRLLIAGGAGILLPTGVLATVAPPQLTTPQIVLLGTAAGNMLTVLLGLTGIRPTTPKLVRFGVSLGTAAALFGFGSLCLIVSDSILRLGALTVFAHVVRRAGEIAYLVFPLLLAVPLFAGNVRTSWPKWLGAFGVSIVVLFGFFFVVSVLRDQFTIVLYGAQRLEWLIEDGAILYALPIAVAFAVGTVGLCSSAPGMRQIGAGVLLTYAAGYAPRATAEVLMMTLGMVLIARGATAMSAQTVELLPESAVPATSAE